MTTYTFLWTADHPFNADETGADGTVLLTDGDVAAVDQGADAGTTQDPDDDVLVDFLQSVSDEPVSDELVSDEPDSDTPKSTPDRIATPRRVSSAASPDPASRRARPSSDIRKAAPAEDRSPVEDPSTATPLAEPTSALPQSLKLSTVAVSALAVVFLLFSLFEPVDIEGTVASISDETTSHQMPTPQLSENRYLATALLSNSLPQVVPTSPDPVPGETSWVLVQLDANWNDGGTDGVIRRAVPVAADGLHETVIQQAIPAIDRQTQAPKVPFNSPAPVLTETSWDVVRIDAEGQENRINGIIRRAVPPAADALSDIVASQATPAVAPGEFSTVAPAVLQMTLTPLEPTSQFAVSNGSPADQVASAADSEDRFIEDITARAVSAFRRDSLPRREKLVK